MQESEYPRTESKALATHQHEEQALKFDILTPFLQVHVDAGKEDCYYQYVHPGATLYVSQQVLKGGDGAIGFAVKTPDGKARKDN